MDVYEAIRRRYSCRDYLDKPVEPEMLSKILEAARLAPSARNFQDWRFVVVTDKALRVKLCEAANNQKFVGQAPVIIAACSSSDHIMRCGQAVGPIDVSIALEHIALQATAEGLATCWVGSFYPDKVRAILDIPDHIAVIELMTLGYPADRKKPTTREPLERIVSYEKWRFTAENSFFMSDPPKED
ncbi:MAG: nitroreductase family protein [Sedimentisphaerales bacterium]|nr:nitroreductase family protein [Sedimentisphaerales bacterium]